MDMESEVPVFWSKEGSVFGEPGATPHQKDKEYHLEGDELSH